MLWTRRVCPLLNSGFILNKLHNSDLVDQALGVLGKSGKEMASSVGRQTLLENVSGMEDRKNTVLHLSPQVALETTSDYGSQLEHVIFFPGDVQDFEDEMKENPTAKQWSEWSFERTVQILSDKFKTSHIWLIIPSKKIYKIFCVYKNFVKSESLFGVPEHEGDYGGIVHLQKLFLNLLTQKFGDENLGNNHSILLIAFSKGCIVLNQILHEVSWLTKNLDSSLKFIEAEKGEIRAFIKNIKKIYWLDGGHSGQKDVWVRNKEVLTSLKEDLWDKNLKLFIHVTPYQINDPIHPWKGEEEAEFVTGLTELRVDFEEKLHFEYGTEDEQNAVDKEEMLAKHFQVIKEF